MTTAMAYMLTPDIRIVITAKVTALKALVGRPKRSWR